MVDTPQSPDATPKPRDGFRPLRDLRVALILFTRIPLGFDGVITSVHLARALAVAPAVGLVTGGLGAAVLAAATALGLPPAVAALLAILATILLSGAFHEDGLADAADGLGGATPERALEIMRDSRNGSYGTLALLFSVILRAAALAALLAGAGVLLAAAALVAAQCASRAAPAAMAAVLEPARADGLAAALGRDADPAAARRRAAIAVALGTGLALALLAAAPVAAASALLVGAAAAAGVAWVAARRFGGHTGDLFGAAQQAMEIAMLVVISAWP